MFHKLILVVIFVFTAFCQHVFSKDKDTSVVISPHGLNLMIAENFYKAGSFDSALVYYNKADSILRSATAIDTAILIKILEKIGTINFNLRRAEKAQRVITQYADLSKSFYGKNSIEYAKSLISLSTILIYFQKYDEALPYLHISKKNFSHPPGKYSIELAKVASNISCVYRGKGLYTQSFECIHEGLNLLSEVPESYEKTLTLFKSYINQGNVYSSVALYEKALQAYLNAIALKKRLKPEDDNTLLILYNNISVIYLESGDFLNLLKSSTEAYKLCTRVTKNDFRMLANILNAKGVAYSNLDSMEQSKSCLGKALEMVNKQNNKLNLITSFVYQNLGNYYRKMGNLDSSQWYFSKSLSVLMQIVGKQHLYTALVYKNMGDLYLDKNQLDSAQFNFQESYKIYDSIKIKPNIKYLELLYSLANVYYKRGEYKQCSHILAIADLKIKEYQSNIPKTNEMSNTLLGISGKLSKISYVNALMFPDTANYIVTLNKSRAVQLLKESKDKVFTYELSDWGSKNRYILLKENLYLNEAALKVASEKGNLDEITRLTFENKQISDSINILKNNINKAWPNLFSQTHEPELGHKLKQQLSNKQAIISFLIFEDSLWINLISKHGIDICKTKLDKNWQIKLMNYLIVISGYNSDLYKVTTNGQEYLYNKEMFIEKMGPDKYAEFILNGNTPLNTKEVKLYQDQYAVYFYNLLFGTIENKINFYNELIIIPDEELYILPYMHLHKRVKNTITYLVENWNIRLTNSLSIFIDKNAKSESYKNINQKELLAIGIGNYKEFQKDLDNNKIQNNNIKTNYTGSSSNGNLRGDIRFNIKRLWYTRQEIENITQNLPPEEYDILYDSLATEDKIVALNKSNRLSGYKIIHIATHGFLEDKSIFGGGLAMYDLKMSEMNAEPGNDGYLSFFEILKLNLKADLVVLSACNTGRGRIIDGEGVYGLNYAFYIAGANNIISTLWGIEDKSTSAIFSEFYERLKVGETYIQALNTISRIFIAHNKGLSYKGKIYSPALVELLKNRKYLQPYYWAAFTLW